MSSLNKVSLIGNLGADPEVKTFQNGGRVCNLSIATSEKWKDKQTGEARERTEWHRVSIFNDGLVGVAEKYLRKGSKVYVEGQLETRKWQDQSGNDRYSTEVVLRPFKSELVLLGDPPGGRREDRGDGGQAAASSPGPSSSGPSRAPAGGSIFDDEIPFAPEWRI